MRSAFDGVDIIGESEDVFGVTIVVLQGDLHAQRTTLHTNSRETIEITGDIILPPYSAMVRQGEVDSIDVWLE